jgi:hypothetical protein
MQNVYIRGRKGHGLILLSKLLFFDYINYWGVFAHLKFFLICVPTSVGRGGWQATWDNVPSLTRFLFDGFHYQLKVNVLKVIIGDSK